MDSERILYFSDPAFPKALADRLAQRGYVMDGVRRGDDFLQKAFAERVSLIIAFAEMPGLNGLELCRDIKANAGLRDIPVFVFAVKKGGDRAAYYSAGCDGYYEAPFDEVNVAQRVDELLVDRSTARRLSLARLAIDYKLNAEVMRLSPVELQDATIFLFAKSPLELATKVKFSLSLAGKTLIDAYGEVSRVEPNRGDPARPSGMCVRFNDMDDGSRRVLEALARQRTVANATWEELSVDVIGERLAAAMSAGVAAPKKDAILERAGLDVAKLPSWILAAYAEVEAPEGELDLLGDVRTEARAVLRESAAVLGKLTYHLSRYGELFYISKVASKRMNAHSEEVLGRADATGDLISGVLGRLGAPAEDDAALTQLVEHLTMAQDWLIEKMVRLRTVVADSQRPPDFAQPTVSDGELCPSQELRYRALGLVELCDFSSTGARKEYAKTLPIDLDLSELSTFEVVALFEGKQAATSMHPDVGSWTRTLVARTTEVADFLRDRRPVKETKSERIAEISQFATDKLTAILEMQEHFRRDLQRLSDIRAVSRAHLGELASTHRRLLERGARLYALYALQGTSAGASDLGVRLVQAAQSAGTIVSPTEGQAPLVIPVLGASSGESTGAKSLDPSNAQRDQLGAQASKQGRLASFLAANPLRKYLLLGGLVVLLVGGGLTAYLSLRTSVPSEGPIDVAPYRALLPLRKCDLQREAPASGDKKLLRCVVEAAWRKQPMPARRKALQSFRGKAAKAGLEFKSILLFDPFDTELGIASDAGTEVYDN